MPAHPRRFHPTAVSQHLTILAAQNAPSSSAANHFPSHFASLLPTKKKLLYPRHRAVHFSG